MRLWLSEHRAALIVGVLIFLVSALSFGLGYLAAQQGKGRAPIIIEKVGQ